ncbi:MAG: hypothetical protein H6Q68_2620 [Firmicutes bacterium]|nr:hypothetical protein [Bacillota bacterium]
MKKKLLVFKLLISFLILGAHTAHATEVGSSYYFPGSATTFATSVKPAPGLMMVNEMLFYNGKVDTAVARGLVHVDLKATALYNYVGGFYTFEKPVLGSRLQIGAVVPVGHVDFIAKIASINASDNHTDIGDTVLSAALYWKKDDIHYKLIQSVYAPTGGYSINNLANVGRNYWGFDTSLVMTWLNVKKGIEISVTPGIMFNTKNTATDYKSGDEFHVDFAVNQYLSQNLAVGLQGYYYRQLTGDSGSGAKLGSFKGEAFGIGPAVLWMPKYAKGNVLVIAKWLHDVNQTKRMHGDYGQLTVGYKF